MYLQARCAGRRQGLRKKMLFAIFSACTATALITGFAATVHYGQGEEHSYGAIASVQSRTLGEQRDVIVHLPESYERDPTRRYPVLYVLDGESHAPHTAESARLMARIGVIPELIVVGLPNTSGEARARDYTPPYILENQDEQNDVFGAADRFLHFIESELIPHIDRTYRTRPTRMLAGNSRGGLLVVYSLLEKPDLFAARFAHSPALWRDDRRIVDELAGSFETRAARSSFLYLSLGDGENEKMTTAFREAVGVLRTSASPALRWRADLTTGANHQNNAILSTPVGLYEYYRTTGAVESRLRVRS